MSEGSDKFSSVTMDNPHPRMDNNLDILHPENPHQALKGAGARGVDAAPVKYTSVGAMEAHEKTGGETTHNPGVVDNLMAELGVQGKPMMFIIGGLFTFYVLYRLA